MWMRVHTHARSQTIAQLSHRQPLRTAQKHLTRSEGRAGPERAPGGHGDASPVGSGNAPGPSISQAPCPELTLFLSRPGGAQAAPLADSGTAWAQGSTLSAVPTLTHCPGPAATGRDPHSEAGSPECQVRPRTWGEGSCLDPLGLVSGPCPWGARGTHIPTQVLPTPSK